MSTIIPPSLNFKTVEKASPSYTYLKVPIYSIPSGTFALSFTNQSTIDFKLPNKVINLGRSYLGYINSYAIESGTTNPWVPEDTTDLAIGNASLMSSQGTDVMNLNYTTNFLKIAAKLGTTRDEVLNNGAVGDGLYCNNQVLGTMYYPGPFNIQANNIWGFTANAAAYAGMGGTGEVQVISTATAAGAALVKYRQFPLSFFCDTILSLDKDVYFGPAADMFLRFMVGGTKCGFGSTGIATPLNLPTALLQPSSTITDMYLYLCIENNQEVINTIMDTFHNEKLTIQIPYTVGIKTYNASSTVNNVIVPITKANGKYLKKVVHTLFNGQESANLNFDMSNWNGIKCLTYNTLLDQQQLQPSLVSCAQPIAGALNSNDYAINKRIIRNSAIVGLAQYQNNWFHCDTWYDDASEQRISGDNIREGLYLTDNHIWTFSANVAVATAVNNYTFITYSRDLHIGSNGLQYV
jgi:hypothetical protein